MNFRSFSIFLSFFGIITGVTAQSLPDSSQGIYLQAAADIYYAYSFNRPEEGYRLYTTQAVRHNEFNVNWAYLKAGYEGQIVRGAVALHTGTYPLYNYAEEGLLRAIAEAHVGLKISPKVWLDAGVMPSHIGYETTFSGDNELYTRAMMADGSPYFSTGVQLSAALSEQLSLKAVVVNGWQNILETNSAKSLGINLNFHPRGKWEFNYSNYFGNEAGSTNPDYRFFQHSYVKFQATEALRLVVSLDVGLQGLSSNRDTRTWWTGMLIGQWQASARWALATRLEFYHDPHTLIITPPPPQGYSVRAAALDLSFRPVPSAVIRILGQWYGAADPVFPTADGSLSKYDFLIATSMAVQLP